jgi:hypothetical protein
MSILLNKQNLQILGNAVNINSFIREVCLFHIFIFVGRGVSHSALSDMKTIEQESPSKAVGSSGKSAFDRDSDRDGFFDDFHFSSLSPGFGM